MFLKLALLLLRFLVFYLHKKNNLSSEIVLLWLENQHYRRYFEQRHIKLPFEVHEKYAIHTFFKKAANAVRFFSIVSPQTILNVWKNAIKKYWTYPARKGAGGRQFQKKLASLSNR
jgi:hypothetical protein